MWAHPCRVGAGQSWVARAGGSGGLCSQAVVALGVCSGFALPLPTAVVTPSWGPAGAHFPEVVFAPREPTSGTRVPAGCPPGAPCLLLQGCPTAQGHPGGGGDFGFRQDDLPTDPRALRSQGVAGLGQDGPPAQPRCPARGLPPAGPEATHSTRTWGGRIARGARALARNFTCTQRLCFIFY